MSKPDSLSSRELVRHAQATMKNARFPHLATIDGDQPRVRPVSPVRVDGFIVYVELCYLDERHDQVRITGVAEVLADAALLDEIWNTNPLLRKYLGTPDNPELIVYRIRPTRVRFMREWALKYYELPLDPP